MHMHQQSNEWEAPDLIAKQNPGTGRSLFAGKKDAIPYPYFALLYRRLYFGEGRCTHDESFLLAHPRSRSFPFLVFGLSRAMHDDGSPPCTCGPFGPFGLFGLFSERGYWTRAWRARSGQSRGQATRKDEGRSIRWHGTRLSSSLASEHLSASPPV